MNAELKAAYDALSAKIESEPRETLVEDLRAIVAGPDWVHEDESDGSADIHGWKNTIGDTTVDVGYVFLFGDDRPFIRLNLTISEGDLPVEEKSWIFHNPTWIGWLGESLHVDEIL